MSITVVLTSYIDGTYTPGILASSRSTPPRAGVRPRRLPVTHDLGDLGDDLLALAEHGDVDEVGERLGIERAVAADDHERSLGSAIGGVHRHAGQVDHLEHVRVDELGGEVEGEDVEVAGGTVGVDREQRQAGGAQSATRGPARARRSARRPRRPLVQDFVEDLQALVGQADLVGVGVGQQPRHLRRRSCRGWAPSSQPM